MTRTTEQSPEDDEGSGPTPPAPRDPHSGEGADSALKALQKKRIPGPKPPAEGDGKA